MTIRLTAAAAKRITDQLQQRGHGVGLRLGVKPSGCSGYSYTLDFADDLAADDSVFETCGAKVVVARSVLPMLEGLTLDYRREGLSETFKFDNPQAQALCGCGESFSLEKPVD
ncbi:MAG: iron-sulfur cluster assembly accessory protein [Nevskiales bacterium]|nr:iron-sulfur cluster assembly accessory protein [Nevskiales bacterium]